MKEEWDINEFKPQINTATSMCFGSPCCFAMCLGNAEALMRAAFIGGKREVM